MKFPAKCHHHLKRDSAARGERERERERERVDGLSEKERKVSKVERQSEDEVKEG